jgi:hypothetical protein
MLGVSVTNVASRRARPIWMRQARGTTESLAVPSRADIAGSLAGAIGDRYRRGMLFMLGAGLFIPAPILG